jgi:hypothetical protein
MAAVGLQLSTVARRLASAQHLYFGVPLAV